MLDEHIINVGNIRELSIMNVKYLMMLGGYALSLVRGKIKDYKDKYYMLNFCG